MITYAMSREAIEAAGKRGATKDNCAKVLDDFILYTDKNEQSVGQWLANEGYWEAWITSWMTHNIKDGFTCIDIGANYGYYTRVMERLCGKNGMVYAFEANKDLCDLLTKSCIDHPIDNGAMVNLHNIAVSDSKGKVTLHIPPNFIGGSSIVWKSEPLPSSIGESEWTSSVEVDSDTLDNVLDYVGHVDLIKIDIEGAEPLAWRGMQKIVGKTDIIVMELGNYLPSEFINELYSKFTIAIIENNGYDRPIERDEFNKLNDLIMGVLRKR